MWLRCEALRHPPCSTGTRVEPGGDLVPDRVGNARVILDQNPLADERHGRSRSEPLVELPTASASIEIVPTTRRRRPSTRISVPVMSRRNRLRSRRGRCRSTSAGPRRNGARSPCSHRARAVSRARGTTPSEARLESFRDRIGTERRDPVERDAAANGVEPRLRVAQRRRAVRDVPREDACPAVASLKRSTWSCVNAGSDSATARWLMRPTTSRPADANSESPSAPSRCRA